MLAKTYSFGINGLEAYPVTIEVDVSRGLPSTVIVGLPDNAVRESKERVRSAIRNSGYEFKLSRLTVNLSPADTKKEGPSFDLAMALGILAATEQIDPACLNDYAFLGELSLDGHIQPVSGTLSAALGMDQSKLKGLLVPAANAAEAAMVGPIDVFPVRTLNEAIHFLTQPETIKPFKVDIAALFEKANHHDVDFCDVKGQAHVKRGLEIAAAGGHNVLMIGPPGSGKSMLAKRLPTILPEMTVEEALETTRIHSVMGLIPNGSGVVATRPFRSPHHTTSDVAVVGGGSNPRPGEVTLSHNGVLFLDELPEFNRNVLETLRQPLEDGCVTICRASRSIRFPSQFMLISAMNPCPCGQYGNPRIPCRCGQMQIEKYRSRISGPLLDRIDIHLDVPAVNYTELSQSIPSENSAQIKERVNRARAIQQERFKGATTFYNARMSHKQVRAFCALDTEATHLLKTAMTELNFSARAYDKILKVARTIADLAGSEDIKTDHLAEAVQYRSLDRDWWG